MLLIYVVDAVGVFIGDVVVAVWILQCVHVLHKVLASRSHSLGVLHIAQ